MTRLVSRGAQLFHRQPDQLVIFNLVKHNTNAVNHRQLSKNKNAANVFTAFVSRPISRRQFPGISR